MAMVAATSALLVVASLQAVPTAISRYHAFSCDTTNSTTAFGGNVFSAVGIPTVRGTGCQDGAGPGANPLGPCFTPPAAVKPSLDAMPEGGRAITLEAGKGMYYLIDPNTSKRWGGMKDMYYMDTLETPAKVQGPWADVWAAAITRRFDLWFGELKRIGGSVDLVMSDFEMGGQSDSFNWVHQPTADGSNPVVALLADPRWPALREQLDAVGKLYNISFDNITMHRMPSWTPQGWEMHVWRDVVTSTYVASKLNTSIFEAIRKHFPNVRLSNFAHAHHTDPSGVFYPASTDTLWPGTAMIGLGAHVGTHQSRGFYGGTNSTRVISAQRPGPSGMQTELSGNSFNALLYNVLTCRDMVRAAPTIPVHPWLAPKEADWGKGFSYLSSGNHSTDEIMMWEENVFHLALSSASTEFLWWQPGSEWPEGIGQMRLSKVLKELDWVTGITRTANGVSCQLSLMDTNMTVITNWAPSFIMSAMSVKCSDGYTREVYRFTPRCTRTIWCTWWGDGAYPPRNGTLSPSWRIGSGWDVTPVQGGTVLLAADPVSTAGAWLVRDG